MNTFNKESGARTAKGVRTRAKILESALRLFREAGFEATTMRQVAGASGVSVGNAYYYFASKEHLVHGFHAGTVAAFERRCGELFDRESMLLLQGSPKARQRARARPARSAVGFANLDTAALPNWIATEASPAASTLRALRSMPDTAPVLVTTADHALLQPAMVDHFCARARESGKDLVAGVASHREVTSAFPELHRTALRFAGEPVSGCNLFAFLTPAARDVAELWKEVEHQRKRPWRLVRTIGMTSVLRYLLGRLTLEEALERLSRRMDCALGVVRMPFPSAAVDVDTAADLEFVRSRLAGGA